MAFAYADRAYSGTIIGDIRDNNVSSPAQSGANKIPSGFFAGPKLVRGSIVSKYPDSNNRFHRLWFLWNPNQIGLSYGFNDQMLPSQQDPGSKDGILGFVQGQQITFSLIFNRLYEVNQDPNSLGVLEDVAVFDHLVGATTDDDGSIQNQHTYVTNAENTSQPSMLRQLPVTVSFGGTAGGTPTLINGNSAPRTFGFDGYITGAQWTFDMFTARMVPITAQLDITMTRTFSTVDSTTGIDTTNTDPTQPGSGSGGHPAATHDPGAGIPGVNYNPTTGQGL